VKNSEYERIVKEMEYNLSARHSFLTFAFTTTLAILGVAFTSDIKNEWLFLAPFFLIVPFTARIAYLRQTHAHYSSFLRVFYSEEMIWGQLTRTYCPIRRNRADIIIEVLVNFEMFFLSLCCTAVFFYKYPTPIADFLFIDWVKCSIPILLSGIVVALTMAGYNYGKMMKKYEEKWIKAKNCRQEEYGTEEKNGD